MNEVTEKRLNNFDLIRLLAALQVASLHLLRFFEPNSSSAFKSSLASLLKPFPGVPIFFVISGFLIYASVENSQGRMARYWRGRALRIYPALWVCTIAGAIMLWLLGYFSRVAPSKIIFWFVTTVIAGGASLNPDFLRSLPAGVWNGALWTIAVELSFYLVLPLIFFATRCWKDRRGLILSAAALVSFCTFIYFDGLHWGDTRHASVLTKVVWFSLAGNLWMFLLGSIARHYWRILRPLLIDKLPFWGISYLAAFCLLNQITVEGGYGVYLCAAAMLSKKVILALAVLSAAYSYRSASRKILRGHDISYGLYLYHMVIYNALLHYHRDSIVAGLIGLAIAIGLAVLSWLLVEERCLRLKDPPRSSPIELGDGRLTSPSACSG
jgi:peptidoglycan/LPS O-acetylase OafA/YrhL